MQRSRGVRIVAVAAVASVIAVASAWTASAPAAQHLWELKTVAGTVSCSTLQGSMQLDAIAYCPARGYGAAFIYSGPPNTGYTVELVGVQTDKSNYTVDRRCSRTKKFLRFTHRGLGSAGVVKAGYNQSPIAYCAVPGRVLIRYRFDLSSSGKPATATIAVWKKSKKSSRLREVGYVEWSPKRSITYYSRQTCTSQY
jgi:hypothetical protein